MPYYETLPVIIEAIQFTGNNFEEIEKFSCGKASYRVINDIPFIAIETLEGTMIAGEGAYIIRGTQGEYYPCIEKVFEAKYRLADGVINESVD